jgi:hypothetical protein
MKLMAAEISQLHVSDLKIQTSTQNSKGYY